VKCRVRYEGVIRFSRFAPKWSSLIASLKLIIRGFKVVGYSKKELELVKVGVYFQFTFESKSFI
jgi:hypothetical protein